MKAEMVADIRSYDPGQPTSPTTWAWDSTQQQVIGYTPLTDRVELQYILYIHVEKVHPILRTQ
jgi:hypothetical protein